MIVPPSGVRVLVATRPVDFRRGADGLAAIVQTVLRHDPFSGTIYVFRCKRADRVKLLVWDGSGLVLLWKRLESGAFRWPPVTDGVMRLSAAQLAACWMGWTGRGCTCRASAGRRRHNKLFAIAGNATRLWQGSGIVLRIAVDDEPRRPP